MGAVTDPGELVAFGWDGRTAAAYTAVDAPDRVPGRVVRVQRGFCTVVTSTGVVQASAYTLASRRAGLDHDPACGDWVALVDEPVEGMALVAIVPRWSALVRKHPDDRGGGEQVLVANADRVGITTGLDRPVSPNRLERTLALVWESGAEPVVIFTKADLVDDAAPVIDQARDVAGKVDIVVTSAVTGDGIADVRHLAGAAQTLAFLGPSGAGKSRLINALLGDDVQATGAVRGKDQRGRHTTVTRDLIPLPGGGVLVDTPGLRSLGLWEADEGVAATFTDIEELAGGCRFRDCRHDAEPGCAVRAAVAAGELERRRLESWHKLQGELSPRRRGRRR
jgi:ribosome biogenesis GTPase